MKKFLSVLLFLFIGTCIYAQSSEVVTEILESSEVTFGQVCYLSAVYQGFIGDNASYEQAIDALTDRGQIPAVADKRDSVVMVNLAFIYAQMWNLKGGLMYRITNGSPRYAFKQMKADGVIAESINPGKIVTGPEALRLFTACSLEYGKQQISID